MSHPHLPSSVLLQDKDRILVVDDNVANLRVISEVLGQHYELSIATSGERALAQIKAFAPDLVILDIMMSKMGGFETCRCIKADLDTCDIPIIFMTALADVQHKVEGLSLGAVDYITKPFHAEEVLVRVNTHISLQKTKRKLQISENKLKASEKRLNDILSSLKEVVWAASLDPFEFSFLNTAVESVYGLPAKAFLQNSSLWLEIIHEDDRELICDKLMCAKPIAEHQTLEYRIVKADGDVRWISCQYKAYINEETEKRCLDGIAQDITERKRAELKLLFRAQHDNLTKLANRAYFMKRLEQRLLRPRAHEGDLFGLLFIDLDGFKLINDNLGHHIGDQLLIAVSERLLESVRNIDLVARLGGDEFTILMQQCNSSAQIIKTCDRIKAQFERPFLLEGQTLTITASIGIALNNRSYHSADEMMRDADFAMYQAKGSGKDCFQLFDHKTDQRTKPPPLDEELRNALVNDEFFLEYQPIVNLVNHQLEGFESLVRWRHPHQGILPPAEFIPIAEQSGMMPELGLYLFRKTCEQIKQWQNLTPRLTSLKVSVNLSSYQLQDPGFLDSLNTILENAGVQPCNLQFEIIESSLIANSDIHLRLFKALQNLGIELCLDDFGTGYSSLSYLHKFPITILKIDRSFIKTMKPGNSSFEIVQTIVSLTHVLNIKVVAEGVETEEQVQQLKSLNCEMAQGHLYAKPLTADAATAFLRDGNAKIQVN